MRITGLNTFTGPLLVSAGTVEAGTLTGGTATTLGARDATRTITVSPGATLSFISNNILGGSALTAANTPTILLDGGTLTSTRYNTIGNVTLNGGTLTQATTDSGFYEGYQFVCGVTVGGTAPSFIATGNGRANHLRGNAATTFTVADATGSPAADLVVSARLRDGSGDFPGAGALVKDGPGTMNLTAANSYTGPTTISAGTLLVDGSTNVASAFAVAGGATLGGDGTVNGPVTLSAGASLTAGSGGPGSLATGGLSLDNAAILNFELAAANQGPTANSDRIDVAGPLQLDGVLNVTALPGFGSPAQGDAWRLFTYTGPLTDNAPDLGTLPPLSPGLGYAIDTTTTPGQVDLVVVPVPEPSAVAPLGLAVAAAMAGFGRRRRRRCM
jgi:autotransporter-associated beta strand protein